MLVLTSHVWSTTAHTHVGTHTTYERRSTWGYSIVSYVASSRAVGVITATRDDDHWSQRRGRVRRYRLTRHSTPTVVWIIILVFSMESQQQPKAGRIIIFRPVYHPSFLLGERQFCSSSSPSRSINPVNDVNRSHTNQTHYSACTEERLLRRVSVQFSSVFFCHACVLQLVVNVTCRRCVLLDVLVFVVDHGWRIHLLPAFMESGGSWSGNIHTSNSSDHQRAICANREQMSGGLADPMEHLL